jgi:outer membrane protein assembly factor BamB
VLERLKGEFGDKAITVEGSRYQAGIWAEGRLRSPAYARTAATLPKVGIGVTLAWRAGGRESEHDARLLIPGGPEPEALRSRVLVHLEGQIQCLDLGSGAVRWAKACTAFPPLVPLWQDGHLVVVIDGDLAVIDPGSGEERWRMSPAGIELLDVAAGHGKVYAVVRDLLSSSGLSLRGMNLLGGEKVQEVAIPRLRTGVLSVGDAVVVVADGASGIAHVLDGLTGAMAAGGRVLGFERSHATPFMSRNGLLVSTLPGGGADNFRMVGKNPLSGETVWTWNAATSDVLVLKATPDDVVLRVRQRGARGSAIRIVTVLDPARGTSRCTVQMEPNELVTEARVAGDRLYLTVIASPPRSGEPARLVHACDVRTGQLLWKTLYFGGRNVDLYSYPTADYLLLRRSGPRGGFSTEPSEDGALFFFDAANGKAVSQIELGAVSYAHDDPGLVVKEGVLVLTVGPEVRLLRE